MKIGYLYQKDKKTLEKEIKAGIEVSIGADVSTILDTINVHEVNNPNNPGVVLALLKKECLIVLEKVTENTEGVENERTEKRD